MRFVSFPISHARISNTPETGQFPVGFYEAIDNKWTFATKKRWVGLWLVAAVLLAGISGLSAWHVRG